MTNKSFGIQPVRLSIKNVILYIAKRYSQFLRLYSLSVACLVLSRALSKTRGTVATTPLVETMRWVQSLATLDCLLNSNSDISVVVALCNRDALLTGNGSGGINATVQGDVSYPRVA